MVGHTLKVYTKSCTPGSKGYVWTSTGKGAYDVAEVEDVEVDFSNDLKIKEIIQKYSNFVGFPIKLNGEVVNTVEPIWTKSANEITEEDHKAFFNQLTSSYNSPRYNLIYKADAPLSIRSVLYIPETSPEWLGMATSQTGINLYSRKVMIQAKSPHLLPNWLRFISGVVDSEDIPLNLSREILQNGALIQKLKSVLTNRVVKWLIEEERRDPEKFELFYTQFHMYIKEGVVTDDAHKDNLMKLLRFNSSALDRSKKTTFQSYLDRKKPEQKSIYYLCRTFDNVEDNPYYEPFKAAGVEVMVLTEPIDEMLIQQLENFKDTPLVNIESKKASEEIQELSPTQLSGDRLTDEDGQTLSDWIREEYGAKLSLKTIRVSKRQSSHPALVVGHDAQNSIYFQQLMKQSLPPGESLPLSPVTLEINTSHALIKGLFELKQTNPQIAKDLAYQICCNARIAAGVMEDTKPLLTSLNNLLTDLVKLKLDGVKKE
ncbi:TNF receptor-associated protein 1, isoform CRA_b [Conidiobolus coronatus NRRL 28638]|uniref:TNF receptor-associated protein 1, isoform CRA_b n=1 Tax=Conidiobolus coronatus (strain ATCC 28846 / CBS 209.66 / NRRL 28638) TaxID=796925 RepID=A0A137NQ32_CONC2|nr:TNF receptor-associated protein 1, isoform CRA_b [Conidiobolus coronatus NRRL 28638]|eukprot:KXN64804.1 TNF receptor-associated protein 1, isoform CRA_b [Conidiobolus coronatus NRRL 28638]